MSWRQHLMSRIEACAMLFLMKSAALRGQSWQTSGKSLRSVATGLQRFKSM